MVRLNVPSNKALHFATAVFLLAACAACGNGFSQSGGDSSAIAAVLPGAPSLPEELTEKLNRAWAQRESGYVPRTQHLNDDGTPKFTNRLFLEDSPYLLQHAHNPMNWHPWGDKAFVEAKRLGRPVLLSIGYSTCHWCHVMEEESFDDIEIAQYINENYIAIKVDREERPDIDTIYMSAVHAMGQHGGWPMTAWLTPDRQPFYAGTYFPARDGDRGAAKGFLTILQELRGIYGEHPDKVAEQARAITAKVEAMLEPAWGLSLPGADVLREAVAYYRARFDPDHGGTRGAPKFPSGLSARLLLRYHRRTGEKQYLDMVVKTLDGMARGGIYDHIGGGFHRYATDARWQVPHFEKMLYDNSLLVVIYLEAYQASGREDFARVAREILRYVERDMTSPKGAFYSATDADSPNPMGHREEGWFFTWTPVEVEAVLGKGDARLVNHYYDIAPEGNFEGRNIPNTPKTLRETAKELSMKSGELRSVIERSREKLYQARLDRSPPLRDDKVLTSWNAMMVSALATAALVLGEEDYARRAEQAADFLLDNLRRDGRLLRSYRNGQARHNAYLDDYAFLIAALLDLYEVTSKPRWLRTAMELDQVLEEHYEDQALGGFFMTSGDHERLLAREKPAYDGAEPSGNSVSVLNLLRLHEFTTRDEYRQRAEKAFRAFESVLARAPAALSEMMLALDFFLDTPKEIVIVTPTSRTQAEPFWAKLRGTFLPNRILSVVPQGEPLEQQTALIPLLEGKRAIKGKTTAYVCEQRVCELPTSDPVVFAEQIRKVAALSYAKRR